MDEKLETWSVEITADTASLRQALSEMTRLGDQFASKLTGAFADIALHGRKLEDVVRSLGLSLANIALKAALAPVENAIGGLLNGLIGGIVGQGALAPTQSPVPFARGGVLTSPALFPMAGGQTGLAGERGAEAILPLARGPDGRLGVRADPGQGITINFNVSTPDIEGFRRSQGQIAAILSRALANGQRNL